MGLSRETRQVVGWRARFMTGCPLSVARTISSGVQNLRSLTPVDWEGMEDEPPRHMSFRLTERCNAKCSFCCYRMNGSKNDMWDEVFYKAASEYKEMGGTSIRLNALTGEPLLDPRFFEKMALLRSLGGFEQVVLTTNGILLSDGAVVEKMLDSGITKVMISTSGFDRAAYERYMGVPRYDEALAGITNLMRRNHEAGRPLAIELAIRGTPEVIDTPDFNDHVLPLVLENDGKASVTFLRLYCDWIGQVKVDDLPADCGLMPKVRFRHKPCSTAMNVGVLTNGDLRLCNSNYSAKGEVDDLRIGNIMEGRLEDIWYSEDTKRIRRTTFGSQANQVCHNCRLHASVR